MCFRFVFACLMLSLTFYSAAMSNNATQVSIEFSQPSETLNWVIVNDTVMGGRSAARLDVEDNAMRFYGILSLENNGGFASTRRIGEPKQWSGERLIKLKVKGDGRRYQFRIRTNRQFDGVAYVSEFSTSAEIQTFEFSESDFTPQWRGRRVPNARPLNFQDIEQLGFMLADKRPGEFELLVESITQ